MIGWQRALKVDSGSGFEYQGAEIVCLHQTSPQDGPEAEIA